MKTTKTGKLEKSSSGTKQPDWEELSTVVMLRDYARYQKHFPNSGLSRQEFRDAAALRQMLDIVLAFGAATAQQAEFVRTMLPLVARSSWDRDSRIAALIEWCKGAIRRASKQGADNLDLGFSIRLLANEVSLDLSRLKPENIKALIVKELEKGKKASPAGLAAHLWNAAEMGGRGKRLMDNKSMSAAKARRRK